MCPASAILGLAANPVWAESVSLADVADTTVSVHPDLGGSAAFHGLKPTLYAIAPGGYQSYPLIRFDLGNFTGRTVTGDATLSLSFLAFCCGTHMAYSVHAVTSAWSEGATNWMNKPGWGPAISTGTYDVSGWTAGHKAAFTISQSQVQGWINNGATNFGVILVADAGRDHYWASREYVPAEGAAGDWAPTLSFDVAPIPEPETYAMLLAGLGLLGFAARRKAGKSA